VSHQQISILTSFYQVLMNISNYGMSVQGQLGLDGGQLARSEQEGDRTHIEDDEDPVELGLPSGNYLLVIPRVKKSRGRIAPALLDDLILYFRDCPGSKGMISRGTRNYGTAGPTHVVNWFIASHTDWLRSSNFFPSIPRSRALQISEQNSPSST